MSNESLIYLCNALDERTCKERGITSDSPAATQKVFQIASALNSTKIKVIVLSLGRGGHKGSWRWHQAKACRVGGNVVIYAPFSNIPILTHFVTLFGLLPLIWRLRKKKKHSSVLLAYNRLAHYLLALELSRWVGFRLFLDLEDGDISEIGGIRGFIIKIVSDRINSLCKLGALLASSALKTQYSGSRTVCCYGVAENTEKVRSWDGKLRILLGGTLQQETGVELFIAAVKILKDKYSCSSLESLEFVVTGTGSMAADLQLLQQEKGLPRIRYLGRVSRHEYETIVEESHVGLCLKLVSSNLCDTTFPSKVVEIASSGMLLLTTLVSDVPNIFSNDEVLFLHEERPEALAFKFYWLLENRKEAAAIAKRGQLKAQQRFDKKYVGSKLNNFFFEAELK